MTTGHHRVDRRLFAPHLSSLLDPLLRPEEIERARTAAGATGQRLDEVLGQLGLLSDEAMQRVLRDGFGVVDMRDDDVPDHPVLVDQLRPAFLAGAGVLPLAETTDTLTLGMLQPFDDLTANAIAMKTGRLVIRRLMTGSQHRVALSALYQYEPAMNDDGFDTAELRRDDLDVLRDAASDAPVVRFVQDLFMLARTSGASDIHLRPGRSTATLHLRIRGELIEQEPPPASIFASLISRLKILADLDISERRLPQDGTIRATIGGQAVDIRISTMPHLHGEAVVMRLLSRDLSVSRLADLGFSKAIEGGLERLFIANEGLILVTGPTGSGKSTTLHAGLRQMIRPGVSIVTIEDPVEYRVEGISQIQIDERIGLSFPVVLRSLLRQDPDIILVGEIRDVETARIAVHAALTGHLVLATLHTNSAPAAIPRLVDMGVEPYLLAAVLRGVLSQRLVRTLDGSAQVAVGELMTTTPDLTMLLASATDTSRREAALASAGYRSLREDAEARVATGELDRRDLVGVFDVT